MKKGELKKILIVLTGVLLMSSCTMTKRRYSKGFYIEKNKSYAVKKKASEETKPKILELESKVEPKQHESVKSKNEVDNVLVASVEEEVVFVEKETIIATVKTKSNTSIQSDKRFYEELNDEKVDKPKKEIVKKDEPIAITKREIWAIMGLIFSLVALGAGGVIFPVLGIVFTSLGFKSKFRTMRWISFALSFLVLGSVLFNLFRFLHVSNVVTFYPRWHSVISILF